MIIGKKDRANLVRLRWDNLRMGLQLDQVATDQERLLQYGALVALNDVQKTDNRPVLDEAQHRLSRPAYDALLRFAAPFLKR